ncbi:MAG: hypothetical protein Rubg2KO_24840 [Rubricoccaceae bacterium]
MRFALVLALIVSALPAQSQSSDCPDGLLLAAAPTYHAVVENDISARAHVDAYLCALQPDALNTTADLLRLLALRDSVIENVGPLLEMWDMESNGADWQTSFEALFSEAEAIGLSPIQAEGMIFGLTRAPLPDGIVTVLAPPDLALAIDLQDIEGRTMGSEYPFSDLDAEVDLVLMGEEMRRRYPASPYLSQSQEAFSQALLTLASLHPVEGTEMNVWFAGVAMSEFYPWAGDQKALRRFVDEGTASRYHAPLSAILASPPVVSLESDVELLVAARAGSREEASARALAWLDEGIDVVGPLWLGADDWAVIYRYYPAGDARLDAAETQAETHGISVERVRRTRDELGGY